jgi:hypothetical protein
MTEHPANKLHRAAEKVRGLANAATPGPWHHEPGSSGHDNEGKPWPANYVAATNVRPRFKVHSVADAAYIAAMDPAVGLAIADWLDEDAGTYANVAPDCFPKRPLDVALKILGEADAA